jgi:hypothetical protein
MSRCQTPVDGLLARTTEGIEMRRITIVIATALIASAGLVNTAHSVPSKAGVLRTYAGQTSQGKRMSVGIVMREDGSLGLKRLSFRLLLLTCSLDQTVQRWSVGYFFGGGRGFDLEGRTLDFADAAGGSTALTIQGKVKSMTMDGTLLRFSVASLTPDEEPQLCTTGDLTWSAERTVAPVVAKVAPTHGRLARSGATSVRRLGDGVRVVMTRLR